MNPFIILSVLAQTGGGPASLSFLAYLDIWLISVLVLLAVVVVVGKWLWGRLRHPPDKTDAYYYHEDEEYHPDDDYYSGNR